MFRKLYYKYLANKNTKIFIPCSLSIKYILLYFELYVVYYTINILSCLVSTSTENN